MSDYVPKKAKPPPPPLNINPDYNGEELIDMEVVKRDSTDRIFNSAVHNFSNSCAEALETMFQTWKLGNRYNSKQASHKNKGTWA